MSVKRSALQKGAKRRAATTSSPRAQSKGKESCTTITEVSSDFLPPNWQPPVDTLDVLKAIAHLIDPGRESDSAVPECIGALAPSELNAVADILMRHAEVCRESGHAQSRLLENTAKLAEALRKASATHDKHSKASRKARRGERQAMEQTRKLFFEWREGKHRRLGITKKKDFAKEIVRKFFPHLTSVEHICNMCSKWDKEARQRTQAS